MKASSRRSSMINMDTSLSTFSESFYRLFNNLNEDAEESLVSLLEEKVIPKSEKEEKIFKESYKRPKTLMVDRTYETRRSFHRKRKDNSEDQFLKTYEYYESLHSPAVARRRSSSIAVPQPTIEVSNFLHADKPPRSVSPRPTGGRKCAITTATPQRNRTASMPTVSRQKNNPFQEMAIVSTFSKLLKVFALFVQFTRLSKFRHIIQTFFVIDCCLHSNALLDESNKPSVIKNKESRVCLVASACSVLLVLIIFFYTESSSSESITNKILILINVTKTRQILTLNNVDLFEKNIRNEISVFTMRLTRRKVGIAIYCVMHLDLPLIISPMLSQTRRQDDPDGYYRLRSFSITPNGVCKNLGDCLKTKRSRSSCSVDSSPAPITQRLTGTNSQESNNEVPTFTVGMLGAANVGKTTLSYQFTTSEYICAYDTSLDDEFGQKTVCISLNGQEAEFNIIDIPASEMSVETFCYTFNVDVFVVVYSIIDAQSFKTAEDILLYLWKNDYMASKGVILVGNKADLERRREIPASTGRKLALNLRCKFIETSSGLDHNVDELLVGIFAQVQLNPKRNRMQQRGAVENGKQLFKQILKFGKKAKSCENLFVL